MPRTCQQGKHKAQEEVQEDNKIYKIKGIYIYKYKSKVPYDNSQKKTLLDLHWRYQPTSTLPAKTVSNPADKSIARLCSFYAIQPASTLPAYALPALLAGKCLYAIQPASTLPAYALPALLAGKCLRDPAGKYIARLRVARIARRQMSTRTSRQVHCPPTRFSHYSLANVCAIQPASPLPANALLGYQQ